MKQTYSRTIAHPRDSRLATLRGNSSLGLTLIETIIYVALLGILMSGAFLTSFNLLQSGQTVNGKGAVQEEANFVERKLAWALADMSALPTVSGSDCVQAISITKTGYGKNPVEFRRNPTTATIDIREGGTGAYTAITTSNVAPSCLTFQLNPAECGSIHGVTASFSLNNITFSITQCLRK
jgi:Tfp pilus assembly protein PilE